MVALTSEQKLRKMDVAEKMMKLAAITVYRIPVGKTEADVPVAELQGLLKDKITRLPILGSGDVIRYIVHLTAMYRFVADRAMAGIGKDDLGKLTLQDLARDPALNGWITNFVLVSEHATVADAKALMEAREKCQDVVVTRSGGADEAMLGWLTNVDIGKLSKA